MSTRKARNAKDPTRQRAEQLLKRLAGAKREEDELDSHWWRDHFFPRALSTLRNWHVGDGEIAMQLPTAQDRFVATWLATHALSIEAQAVTASAMPVRRIYFDKLNLVRLSKFRMATRDAGWWQARSALTDANMAATELASLKQAHDVLKEKLLPQLSQLGFLG